nr:MAG TPA: Tail tube protein [Caudoviricetes sp.]
MTDFQSSSDAAVYYKVQSARGTQAANTGGQVLRVAGGPGIKLAKAATQSNEIRSDGMMTRGRHGTQKTTSAYNGEMSLGSHDPILEAIVRSTWDASVVSITQADMTSVTTTANGIHASSGSWLAKGIRVGDVIRGANLSDAANNGKNLRVVGVTAADITVAETLVVNATPDTSFTITRPGKRLINTAPLIKRYFTLEEYEDIIVQSTVLNDFVWGSAKISMAPNGLLTLDPGGTGTGQIQGLPSNASPYFISPSSVTGAPFSVVDATVRLGNRDMIELTAFDLTMNISPTAPDTFGSGAIKYAPDVYTGQMQVSMNITALRKDLQYLIDFIAEQPYSLNILAVDKASDPQDFMAITVPNFTLGGVDPSALSNKAGGRTQSITIPAALCGVDTSATGDGAMIKFQTTAA